MARRGVGSESSASNSRAGRGSARAKEKNVKGGKEPDESKGTRQQDRDNYQTRPNSNSNAGRGGARHRAASRVAVANPSVSVEQNTTIETNGSTRRRFKVLDPTLLGRGMTARYIGARIPNFIKILSPEEIEKDLRHMEAYRCACIVYSQQLFAHRNQDLLTKEMYGLPPSTDSGTNQADTPMSGSDTFPDQPHRSLAPDGHHSPSQGGAVVMPSKIDPDEDKRLSNLRKKIAASEAKREVIESEYVSFRAHFVYQSHRLLLTKNAVYGQLSLLQEMIKRKGSVLALQRVLCGATRDILKQLECTYDDEVPSSLSNFRQDVYTMDIDKDHIKSSSNAVLSASAKEHDTSVLLSVWTLLESKLHDAELACTKIEPPKELSLVKKALVAAAHEMSLKTTGYSTGIVSAGRRSRSPSKGKVTKEDDDSAMNGAHAKKKPKLEKDSKSYVTTEKGKPSKTNPNGDDITSEKEVLGSSSLKRQQECDIDTRVIPWNCISSPRTPFNVPILATVVSEVPSRYAGYGLGNFMGSSSWEMMWLLSNMPSNIDSINKLECDNVQALRDEVKVLTAELESEILLNSEIQKQVIAGRKQNDVLCSAISTLRTETEALLERHNIILDTPEVKERSRVLANNNHSSITEEYYDEGDLGEDEDEYRASLDGDHGEESDSAENVGIGEYDHENDADDEYDCAKYFFRNDDKSDVPSESIKADESGKVKRIFDDYGVDSAPLHEERKRRKP